MPCAMAIAIAYQETGWEGVVAKVRAGGKSSEFYKGFQNVRKQLISRNFLKSWLEEEVEVCKVFGKRLESKSKFLSVEEFQRRWNVSAEEVCPTLVITVTDENGEECRGIPIEPPAADIDPSNPLSDISSCRTLTTFCDEFVIHKDCNFFKFIQSFTLDSGPIQVIKLP